MLAAFEGFAYGFDEESKPRRALPVARILYAPGRVVVERGSGAGTTLVYAISEVRVGADLEGCSRDALGPMPRKPAFSAAWQHRLLRRPQPPTACRWPSVSRLIAEALLHPLQASVSSDDLSNDDGSPLRATTACSELNAGPGLDASSQCKGPDEAHLPCDGSYGIVLRPQYDPLKICALCPQVRRRGGRSTGSGVAASARRSGRHAPVSRGRRLLQP